MFELGSIVAGIAGLATTASIIVTLFVLVVAYVAYEYAGPPLHDKMKVFREMGVPFIPPLQARTQSESAVLLGKKTMVDLDVEQVDKYGKLFGKYDLGKALLMVSEPDLLRDIFVKEFNSFYNRREVPSGSPPMIEHSLFFERDKRWREIRALITPTFSTAKMRTMDGLIRSCLQIMQRELDQRFAKAAAEKNDEKKDKVVVEIDARDYFSNFAMDVIGTVFFGIGVDAITNRDHPFVKNSLAIFNLPKPLSVLLYLLFPVTAIRNYLMKKGLVGLPLESRTYFEQIIPQIISARRNMPPNEQRRDFLNVLIHTREKAVGIDALTASGSLTGNDNADNNEPTSFSKTVSGQHSSSGLDTTDKFSSAASLNDDEIAGQCFIFMIAGFETTSTTIGFLLHELALNQDCQDRLRAEINSTVQKHGNNEASETDNNDLGYDTIAQMAYLDACINETLRLYPPAPRLERECMHDCTLSNGLQVKKGVIIGIPVWHIQRSAENFDEPNTFDPDRFYDTDRRAQIKPYTYMPFGQGPRNCVGMRFALLELKMVTAFVVRNYRIVPTAKTEHPVPLQPRVGGVRPLTTAVGLEQIKTF